MKLKILTVNIALGLRDMDRLITFQPFSEISKSRSPRGFLPRPLLRADKIQKQISLGFAKIHIPRK